MGGDRDSLQYGGEDFAAASLFLRRVVPGANTLAARTSLLSGMSATARLLLSLPRLHVSLTDSPVGERLLSHFNHRIGGIRHARIAQGVLVLPDEEGRYLRGRSRQAVRTGIHKTRAAGIECRVLGEVRERSVAARQLGAFAPGISEQDELFSRVGDVWCAAITPGGNPLTLAQVAVNREWALLESFVSTHRASRYLLHTELVEMLVRAKVRYLVVKGPMAPLLEPSLQYWQRLLGYRVFNLSLSSTTCRELSSESFREFSANHAAVLSRSA